MRTLATTALALVATAGMLALAAPSHAAPSSAERRLIAHVNAARDARDLRRLSVGPGIQEAAHGWARHLRRTDSFRHGRLRPGTGEVIAWGTCAWFTPAKAVRAWLGSPGHRALLLRPGFRRVGAGWSRGRWRSYDCIEMAVVRFR